MKKSKAEDLLIRSLDQPLSPDEDELLKNSLSIDPSLKEQLLELVVLRETLRRKHPASFGPYFAQKIVHKIQQAGQEIDRQIVFFFKRYQLVAAGVVIALLALNIMYAETFSVPSILGVEEATTATDDIITFDYSELLTDDL
jgi:hypothetical protein